MENKITFKIEKQYKNYIYYVNKSIHLDKEFTQRKQKQSNACIEP